MNIPKHVIKYWDVYTEEWCEEVSLVENCTECRITESSSDFTATMSYVDDSVEVFETIRLTYSDGNEYDFKIESISYNNGIFSASMKYKAYELGGIVNEPIVGMFTPKGMIDYLNDRLHYPGEDAPIESTVSCDIDDRYFGIACKSNQLFRSTLYDQVAGVTGCVFQPVGKAGLKLVQKRGKTSVTYLSTAKEVTGLSIDWKATSKPNNVIGYIDWDSFLSTSGSSLTVDDYYNFGYSIDDSIAGASEFYDATSEISATYELGEAILLGEYTVRELAFKHQQESNPNRKSVEKTVTVELAPCAPILSIGDPVVIASSFSDPLVGWGGVKEVVHGKVVSCVSFVEYDVLNECMVSATIGDIQENVADQIAAQNKSIESNQILSIKWDLIEPEDFNEQHEYQFVVPHYNEGDVVLLKNFGNEHNYSDPGETLDDEEYHPYNARISAIDGNVFTLKLDFTPTEDLNEQICLYYIARTEHSLYDTGDLCDLTWSNYSTSYLSFDTAQISLKSGGAARACTNETISLTGYKRLVIEYELTTYKDTYVGLNTTVSTTTAKPNAFYCKLAKGGTKASVEIPDDYLESDELYLKIYALSGAVGKITKIYLQSK